MEDHHELEQLLLAGLKPPDRRHVVQAMRRSDADKLRELRSRSEAEITTAHRGTTPADLDGRPQPAAGEREWQNKASEASVNDREAVIDDAIARAERRDAASALRQRAARLREQAAGARDAAAEEREAAGDFSGGRIDRELAKQDRDAAAIDRLWEGRDLDAAASDRALLARRKGTAT